LQLDDDVGERYGAAAQADPRRPLVVGQHAGRDRPLVAHLAEDQADLANPATAAPAPEPVTKPRTHGRAQHGLAVTGLDPHGTRKDRHLGHPTSTFSRLAAVGQGVDGA
jgi:hypothetical protein